MCYSEKQAVKGRQKKRKSRQISVKLFCFVKAITQNLLSFSRISKAKKMAASVDTESDNFIVNETVSSKSGSFSGSNNIGKENQILKKYQIERSNLLNISKICIKTLIDTTLSVGTGRILTEESSTLEQFFVVFEHIVRHGLKGMII